MQTEPGKITNPPPKTVAVGHYMQQAKKKQSRREQFLNLPEGTPCQLIAGEITMTPSPIPLHQIVIMELSFQMLRFVKAQDQGKVFVAPLDVSLDEKNIFQPDIFFIRKDNLSIIGDKDPKLCNE